MINTLGSGIPSKELIADVSEKMAALEAEIKNLQKAPIPKDYTVRQISDQLKALRVSTDERETVKLLVERIDANKTEANVDMTLASVLNKNGCGNAQYGVFKYLYPRESA